MRVYQGVSPVGESVLALCLLALPVVPPVGSLRSVASVASVASLASVASVAPEVAPSARSCIRRAVGLSYCPGRERGTERTGPADSGGLSGCALRVAVVGVAHRGERSGVFEPSVTPGASTEVACAALAAGQWRLGRPRAPILFSPQRGEERERCPGERRPLPKKAEGSHVWQARDPGCGGRR
jgi:hypothetical protein